MTVTEIKAAIDKLSDKERATLGALLYDCDENGDDAWDRQMREDATHGKLDAFIAEARAQIQRGETIDDMP